jgi:hypothetical protein
MESMNSSNTVGAIYEMREAAERRARAEVVASLSQTAESRGELLDATLELEEKTQTAIEHCTANGCADPAHAHGGTVTDINSRRKHAAD